MRTALIVVEVTGDLDLQGNLDDVLPYAIVSGWGQDTGTLKIERALVLADTQSAGDTFDVRSGLDSTAHGVVTHAAQIGRDLFNPPAPVPTPSAVDGTVMETLALLNTTLASVVSRLDAIERQAA